jgi:hypothetical protein
MIGTAAHGTPKRGSIVTIVLVIAVAAVVTGLVTTVGRAIAAPTSAAQSAPACTATQTAVWLGDGPGGGTAGTYYYPLEFSNVGTHTCTLYGYPGVSAYTSAMRQLGQPANRNGVPHHVVTLAPGGTAHALLGIHDWGAICSKQVPASGLRVYAPGQRSSHEIDWSFGACAQRGVLTVGPVNPGTGIPGYTNS